MEVKYLFENKDSVIAIRDAKIYIVSKHRKDYSIRAITIFPGLQIELGRQMSEIQEALKYTRLPIIIRLIVNKGETQHYQIIRIQTGKVEDKIIATIVCKNNIIKSLAFNKALVKDGQYRRYNQLSILHQISIPYSLAETKSATRSEQIKKILSTVINISNTIKVIEKDNQITALINEEGAKIQFLFIENKANNNRYDLASISILQ